MLLLFEVLFQFILETEKGVDKAMKRVSVFFVRTFHAPVVRVDAFVQDWRGETLQY